MGANARRKQKQREARRIEADRRNHAVTALDAGPQYVPSPPLTFAPTPERLAKGGIAVSRDKGAPAIAPDCLARMRAAGEIDEAQEQVGRDYASLCYAARRSMGIRGVGSCLSGGVGAYDAGDGMRWIEAEWRAMQARLAPWQRAAMDAVALDDSNASRPVRAQAALAMRDLLDVQDRVR